MMEPEIIIQEVGPRDGLQIEPNWVETAAKVSLVNAIAAAGIRRIEVSSFVSPKAVPALRDADDVFKQIDRDPDTIYTALVANVRGADRAIAAQASELNFVMSASETHNLANVGMTERQSLDTLREILQLTNAASIPLNATVATAFGCPFEGAQPVEKVLGIVEKYLELGAVGITLADTTGMANPVQVREVISEVRQRVPLRALTLHFHNTRGIGLLNIDAARNEGVTRFDSSLGGLGGCPFAPGASGNVCTEDLVNYLHEIGLRTGIDLRALIEVSKTLPSLIGHETPGQVAKAGLACELHPLPRLRQTA